MPQQEPETITLMRAISKKKHQRGEKPDEINGVKVYPGVAAMVEMAYDMGDDTLREQLTTMSVEGLVKFAEGSMKFLANATGAAQIVCPDAQNGKPCEGCTRDAMDFADRSGVRHRRARREPRVVLDG